MIAGVRTLKVAFQSAVIVLLCYCALPALPAAAQTFKHSIFIRWH
jgi:hypothetical protein